MMEKRHLRNFGHEGPYVLERAVGAADHHLGIAVVAHREMLERVDTHVQMRTLVGWRSEVVAGPYGLGAEVGARTGRCGSVPGYATNGHIDDTGAQIRRVRQTGSFMNVGIPCQANSSA